MATQKRSTRSNSTVKKSSAKKKAPVSTARKRTGLKSVVQAKANRKRATPTSVRSTRSAATTSTRATRSAPAKGGVLKRAIKKGMAELAKVGS